MAQLTDFIPTTVKELQLRGWDWLDVVLFSGDAYIDHPSFGAAVIARVLEGAGYRVAIVPQPDWRGDWRDFKKMPQPRLFYAITAGAMDSMVNHYTANRRKRSNDAYSPNGQAGLRPDYCTITYCKILKTLFPEVPVVIGGIEASMRRLTHYDYWSDKLMPSILEDSKADVLIYGMGEQPILALAEHYKKTKALPIDIPQIGYIISDYTQLPEPYIKLNSHEQCLEQKILQAKNFALIEKQSFNARPQMLVQPLNDIGNSAVVINPPFPQTTTEQLDHTYDLPYTRLPHPKYKGKTIPAYDMIRFSVCMHRGCFGGCSFCTISAHQGKQITSRSKESILKEIDKISQLPEFKGYISDLGGPSANMYQIHGKDMNLCKRCNRPTCLQPNVCKNLNIDFTELIDIYKSVNNLPYIKKAFVSSGVRLDLMTEQYAEELIIEHVSGRLKVAPEHTEDNVLKIMRKPPFSVFEDFVKLFDKVNKKHSLRQQIIPYFISSHPACRVEDMAQLAVKTKALNLQLEQIQDFTPTPMTLATEMYYTGYDPHTLKPIYTARTQQDKLEQRQFFFYYKPEYKKKIAQTLRRINHPELINKLLK